MFLLAEAGDWISVWQVPVVALLIGGWVFYGGRVLQKQVAGVASRKEASSGRCRTAAVMSCLAGIFCAGIGIVMGKLLGESLGIRWFYLGLPLGILAFLGVSFLTIYASFHLPVGPLSTMWLKAFVPVLIVTVIAAIPSFWISYNNNQRVISLGESQRDLFAIYKELASPTMRRYPPESLEKLLEQERFEARSVRARRNPDRKIGYFYLPATVIAIGEPTTRLLACDWADNQASGERAILYVNGQVDVADPQEFQELLKDPNNVAFAEALTTAEKKLLGG